MGKAVYNSAIPDIIRKTVNRALCPAANVLLQLSFLAFGPAVTAHAADWNGPEQQLARKIVAVTGPGAVALTIENRSSLGQREYDVVQNGLRSALEPLGLRFAKTEQAAATVTISLSENATSYVWVAEIRQGAGESSVVMVSAPRPEGSNAPRDTVPLSLRKIPLWQQDDPILDVTVLEENPAPAHIAVLDPDKVSLYRWQGGKWQQEQALSIAHARPWPRDLRGRLMPARDHLLDVYLPGLWCRTTGSPLGLSCRECDDPWPLVVGTLEGGALPALSRPEQSNGTAVVPQMRAFFAPTRNFFTGTLTPGVGKFTTVSKFFSVAPLPREKYTLWLFGATDSQVHMVDGVSERAAKLDWGSDLTSVKTSCGAGWQVLATSSGGIDGDSVNAYEFPDRDPVAVSAPIDFPGAITALWTEARGDTAIAVDKHRETGSYEAFRLAVACSQ